MTREELLERAKRIAHEAVDENAKLSEGRFLSASGSAAAESGEPNWETEASELAHEFLEDAESNLQDNIDAADEDDDEEEG